MTRVRVKKNFLGKKSRNLQSLSIHNYSCRLHYMNHYKYYSVEDFVQDQRFRSWVKNPTREEDIVWRNWLLENQLKSDTVEEARAIVLAIHPVQHESISDFEIQREVENILSQIQDDEEPEQVDTPEVQSNVRHPRWYAVAASIAVVLAIGWYGIYSSIHKDDKADPLAQAEVVDDFMIERINKSEDALLINLPDKSSVLLSQNSTIRYPREFSGNSREVYMEGTAFFEVTKNPKKPFYVNAGNIVAKVVGTSFEITTNKQDEQVKVVVKSGTVSIYTTPQSSGSTPEGEPNAILTRNEQLIYKGGEAEQIQHTRLNASSIAESQVPDTYLKFNSTPVSKAFALLSKAYGVRINFEQADIEGCSVTASFTDESFTTKVDLICRSIGVKYDIVNDQVSITGNGCKN
jgi:transmembrane sensor